ncbi:hypothetical protein KSP39_PZI021743 [Platanthera zijinensis]|uniref:Uncharacterized protein n=1 Tax=Platanthera zijinensis TaxID=2320716 RepID=A0AAP0AX65_9ASPA
MEPHRIFLSPQQGQYLYTHSELPRSTSQYLHQRVKAVTITYSSWQCLHARLMQQKEVFEEGCSHLWRYKFIFLIKKCQILAVNDQLVVQEELGVLFFFPLFFYMMHQLLLVC